MTSFTLESIATSINYADLPETWCVAEIGRFSAEKTLYDYQTDALQKAAQALFLYYGGERDWISGEAPRVDDERKRSFAGLYGNSGVPDIKKYETRTDEKNKTESQVFRILSEFITPLGDCIPYHNLINRMCFWMATGSGKTLVMVKLIEFLHRLKQHGEIPSHNLLILAPSAHLIGQIRHTIDEFNAAGGLQINLQPLRQAGRAPYQHMLDDSMTVYYHRSDNISDVQKEAKTDYRIYENDGKWFIFLDEAHKGGKENSKRQAYYALMTRAGFLFNFSATFTDKEDIVTTVKKYNLEEFVKNGHGKNIYLNETEYNLFKDRKDELSYRERQKIVLKSLITLGYVSRRVANLRQDTAIENLYHLPLMLTLVNSVNTDVENERNDLWAFFQILRQIATDEIDETLFKDSKKELIHDWRDAHLLFGEGGGGIIGTDENSIQAMKVTDLRAEVFLSRRKGALQFIRSSDNKEIAFQMKNADAPFALIRIGDTSKWRNNFLAGYEETSALREKSFFDKLEQSPITILMGSRSFFESWDTNRPNVINFINIGGNDAKKFVVQSVGRGVRIEPLPNQRRRFARLPESDAKNAIQPYHDQVNPAETLFLFATNKKAVKAVLEGLAAEKGGSGNFEILEGLERAPVPRIDNKEMPLLIPEYREIKDGESAHAQFAMSEETRDRFNEYVERTSDSVFIVRDRLEVSQINALHDVVKQNEGDEKNKRIKITPEKNYATLSFLQNRLLSHFAKKAKASDGIRELDKEDIVHFGEVKVHPEHLEKLQEAINRVKEVELSTQEKRDLAGMYSAGKITEAELDRKKSGKSAENFKDLTIKKLVGHYYLPVVLGNEKASYIQHIVKVPSEIDFLNALEDATAENEKLWDAWMFSKIDESLDKIHIPYYDSQVNEYREFKPDFIFWMCKGDQYRIVLVDPKGAVHNNAYHKIDGYKKLFEDASQNNSAQNSARQFLYGNKWKVSVELLMFNKNAASSAEYQRYWIDTPEKIFHAA